MIGRGDDCNHLTMKIRWMFCWAEKILCSFEFQAGMLLVSEKKAQGKIRMARDRTENVSSRAEAPTSSFAEHAGIIPSAAGGNAVTSIV
jgi:hypothetical protein